MEQDTLKYVTEKTQELIDASTCSSEARTAAQNWLDALGTENQVAQTQKYIAELEADIMPIDNLIHFAESDNGSKVFGENARNVAEHAREIKAAGAKFCDCPACAAAEAILDKKTQLLKAAEHKA